MGADRCEIEVGKIIVHPCAQRSVAACTSCGRSVCKHHSGETSCVACEGKLVENQDASAIRITMEELFEFSDEERKPFDQRRLMNVSEYDS